MLLQLYNFKNYFIGDVEIKEENLILLLEAANYLGSEKAKKIISQYIYNKLNMKNYFFYYKLTKLYKLKNLNRVLCNFLLQQHILNEDTSTFYKLKYEDLFDILSCEELQISSELELFNAAVDWIKNNRNKRRKHMKTFLKLIRLPLLTTEILTDIIKRNNLCKDCLECRKIADKAIKSKKKFKHRAVNLQFQNRFYSCEYETKKVIFIGGRFSYHDLIQSGIEYEF